MAKSIAICIPSYNCGAYIRATIESALAQSDRADEIIVSDDHSTDDSARIVEEYRGDDRVRIIKPPHRLTIGQHYRFLLDHAESDFVTFLSADDVLLPNFIATMRAAIGGRDDVTLVSAACVETDGALKVIQARGTGRRKAVHPYPDSFAYMTTGNLYTVSFSAMERRRLLTAPVLPAEVDLATDWYWALWLTAAGSLAFVKTPLGFYRIHTSNAGHNNSKWSAALAPMLRFLIPHLPEAEQETITQRLRRFDEPDVAQSPRGAIINFVKSAIKIAQAVPYRRMSARFARPPFHDAL